MPNFRLQSLLKDDNNQLQVDDAARIIGSWKTLSKQGLNTDLALDPNLMKRRRLLSGHRAVIILDKSKALKSRRMTYPLLPTEELAFSL
ncbi:MAG: hypothetical protein RIS79_1625 [Verrucomicrobiota bacterium]|jgi:predicted helicase